MSFLQSIARSAKQGYAQAEANKWLRQYGAGIVKLDFNSKGKFSASLVLEGEREELHLTGQLSFDLVNRAHLIALTSDRAWLNRVLEKHALGRELPIPPDQAKQLRELFPA